jgi:phospholipid/cholesterol/gamma-HCH transport system substrate-binding protein
MAKRAVNNVKLGAFVLGALLFLVLLLYMIGKNANLFGATYTLKVRFENVQGLVAGNNVRFSGIQAGTVKKVNIISDTVIEVSMSIHKKMQSIIRKNAQVSISTDGLVGNKVMNIVPSREPAPLAVPGDLLVSKKTVNTEDMLQTLSGTNNDVAIIASDLKKTIQRINNANALWTMLNDQTIPQELRLSAANIRMATQKAGEMTGQLNTLVRDIRDGKGSLGAILKDTEISGNLNSAILKIKSVGNEADSLATTIKKWLGGIEQEIQHGKGPANALLHDSAMVNKLNISLDNIQKGTDGFNQNMEALKRNFLFRGYFRKLEKQKKAKAAPPAVQ